ncbi:MAG: DUF1540 domain-containing protein [Ruminococcus sp.]|nr:DUF1540 domain-containing protein [Ruminococcus sp.]
MSDSRTLRSVKCDVESCIHNVGGKECSADGIKVCSTCSQPDCADETQCKTFSARQ